MSKIQDAQQNLSVLRQESVELANEITLKRSELDSLNISLKQEYDSIQKEKALLKEENTRLNDVRTQQLSLEQNHLEAIQELEEKKRYLSHEIKELTKELSRINAWILEARDEHSALLRNNALLKSEIEERTLILSDIKLLRDAKAALSQEVLKLKIDISEIQDSSNQSLYLARQAKENELEEYKKVKLAREREEIALYNLREQRVKIEHDVSIYVGRAQKVYKQSFPELEMNL